MYQSFTGSARRPRQVNLSGRPSNPFSPAGATGAQQAIATAQQDRLHRQQQRERLQASSKIQRVWRGHASRRKTFKIWRELWDKQEEAENGPYYPPERSLQQLRRLMLFYNPRADPKDVDRLVWYGTRQSSTDVSLTESSPWPAAYTTLRNASLLALAVSTSMDADKTLLCVLAYTARHVSFTTKEAIEYYQTLISISERRLPSDPFQGALLAPLQNSQSAYAGLAILLSSPLDPDILGLLKAAVDAEGLCKAIGSRENLAASSIQERLWLLGNLIAITGRSSSRHFTNVASQLLGSLADSVDFEGPPIDIDNVAFSRDMANVSGGLPLNTFLHRQVASLVDQKSIRSLIINEQAHVDSDYPQILAGYALTLLRCFPGKADDIRMWLYRGPVDSSSVPVTHYLWEASKGTEVFKSILATCKNVIPLIKDDNPSPRLKGDWTIILVFMELWTFVLKIMDDEEFMGSRVAGRQKNPVPIADVAVLVTFLKNLGFTLCFNAAELNGTTTSPTGVATAGGRQQFSAPKGAKIAASVVDTRHPSTVAGMPGLSIDYMKGLVTGLLRAVYERDSRRNFLPKDHWLMTNQFDMQSFIPGVVAEEESRHLVEEQDTQDQEDSDDDVDLSDEVQRSSHGLLVNGHARALRTQRARERAQRKASRRRYMEAVAPRLEILQNLPFFIPFHTRVKIFRQFVLLDQEKRRHGFVDPDMWRQSILMGAAPGISPHDVLSRHQATIKRGQEFLDAYNSFYELGPAFKEPIQIAFVDSFGMHEAGIDGGGVTKEFLTSVITQAFDQSLDAEDRFFVENDKHLLYPNPVAMEEMAVKARRLAADASDESSSDVSATARELQRELLRQYDFLGRIIGKCLYEGILVDVNFAGFFLKQWALTGGNGSAAMESGYRASINDLRELDEDLYRGLLALKNAPDAEAFGAVFAVNNTIGPREVVQVDLIENGADVPVTNENRLTYINYLSRYKLQRQSFRQTNAFLKGLGMMIQPSWLSMFNQSELQTLIGGASAGIDVQDLRKNTQYGGTYLIGDDGQEHPSVKMFWNVMQSMSDEDRRKVLKFVTSTPRGPLLGFSHLNPKFSIRDAGRDENRFPTTSTCVNLLKLPMYQSERTLREKLLAAVNSGAGFDLS